MTALGGRSVLVLALACAGIVVVAPGPESADEIVQVERLDATALEQPRGPET